MQCSLRTTQAYRRHGCHLEQNIYSTGPGTVRSVGVLSADSHVSSEAGRPGGSGTTLITTLLLFIH
jgi:hypothetical protein